MNMGEINIYLYFIINFFDVWVVLRYFDRLLEQVEERKALRRILSIVLVAFFSMLIKAELKYCNLVSLAAWSCLLLTVYKGDKKNKAVYAILLVGFAGFAQTVMYFLNIYSVNTIYSFLIPHLTFFLIIELVVRYQTIRGKKIDIRILILLISVPIISFISMPCMVIISERLALVSKQEEIQLLLPIEILILYMNIMVFYLYDLISTSYEMKRQKEEYEQLVKWQRSYYETLSENQNIIRKIKHDMQNDLQVVNSLINNEEYDKTKAYLTELIKEQSKVDKFISTGNDSIDTVLNIKFSLAEQLGIEVKKDINIPSMLPISYQESIKIFGNLLDNAINALRESEIPEKCINWFMFYNANALIIQVSNPYIKSQIKHDEDKLLHGLGLDIVKSTVEEYNGTFEVTDDGAVFTVNVLLYIDNYIESDK